MLPENSITFVFVFWQILRQKETVLENAEKEKVEVEKLENPSSGSTLTVPIINTRYIVLIKENRLFMTIKR